VLAKPLLQQFKNKMTNEIIKELDSIIVGIFALIGVVLGFLLQLLFSHLSEKKRIKQEFQDIKNSIYYTTIENNLCPELLKLKRFFTRYDKFLKKQENNYFFQKWLMDPCVEEAFTGVGFWNKGKIKEMLRDLEKTKI